jgi:hypothetical protein
VLYVRPGFGSIAVEMGLVCPTDLPASILLCCALLCSVSTLCFVAVSAMQCSGAELSQIGNSGTQLVGSRGFALDRAPGTTKSGMQRTASLW